MVKKGLILGILAVLFLGIGAIVKHIDFESRILKSNLHNLENYISSQQNDISAVINDHTTVQKILHLKTQLQPSGFELLKSISQKDYTLFFYEDDSLIQWTNTVSLPPENLDIQTYERVTDTIIYNERGAFLLTIFPLDSIDESWSALSILPIAIEQESEVPGLPSINTRQTGLKVSQFRSAFPIYSRYTQSSIGYLHLGDPIQARGQLIVLILYILGLFFLLLFLYGLANVISKFSSVLWGVTAMFCGIMLIWLLYGWLGMGEMIQHFIVKDHKTNASQLPDLLINVVLLFWLLAFTYKVFRQFSFGHLPASSRILLASLNHFGILLGMVMMAGISKSLVVDSAIQFNFDNVLNIDTSGIIALFSITSFLLAFFIVSHRMTLTVQKLKLNIYQRLLSIAISFLLILAIFYNVGVDFSILIFYLVAIIYLLLFDIFVEASKPSLRWVLVWLILFSGFSSILLFKYSKDAELLTRIEIAEGALHPIDSALIESIWSVSNRMQTNEQFLSRLKSCIVDEEQCEKAKLQVENQLDQESYIHHYYQLSEVSDSTMSHTFTKPDTSLWTLNDHTSIYFYSSVNKPGIYLTKWYFEDINNNKLIEINFAFNERKLINQPAFNPLHRKFNYKNNKGLNAYDYAIYRENELMISSGHIYDRMLPSIFMHEEGISKEVITNERSELVLKTNGTTVVVGKPLTGILKPLSLFSYIFALLVVALLLLGLLNVYYPLLPESLKFSISRKPTLRNKIQLSVLTLIIFSFIVVGASTVYYFSNSTYTYDIDRLNNKAISVQYDAELKLKDLSLSTSGDDLQQIIIMLSDIHQTDIHLFGINGRLIYSSDKAQFSDQGISPLINPIAYHQLFNKGNYIFINDEERIGSSMYQAAFIPIYQDNDQPQAIISLPYTRQSKGGNAMIGDFMSTLLNVYVLLLMIAGLIAVFVSNSITQPLTELSEKLKSFKLGKTNEPIKWENNDELGALISEYNYMIEKMERSAEILAQNEREVAWREMAKQVAHEIKNPLTPMKLSIQHLMYKIPKLPKDEAIKLIDRVSVTLIEQIDNLTKIASEFSNFSKLPRPNNEAIILNDLVASVHDLFRKREDINFNLYVPIDEIYVMADRSHILRILNNLIKNAVQAIPAIKKGKIDIKLYTLSGMAIIQVKDNGEGIPKDMQDKVFYPNFTTKSSGTGLGLAICKDMAEAYGGKIYFETEEGIGTSFFLELPLMKEDKV